MNLNEILLKIREAQMFKFLTVLPSVKQSTIKICQNLIDQIQRNTAQEQPWVTILQLKKHLHDEGYLISSSQIQNVIDALSRHEITVQRGQVVAFRTSIISGNYFLREHQSLQMETTSQSSSSQRNMRNDDERSFNQQAKIIESMASDVPSISSETSEATSRQSSSNRSLDSSSKRVQSSSQQSSSEYSQRSATYSSSSSSSSSVKSSHSESEFDEEDNQPSPLSSYFSSVNTALTNQRSSSNSSNSMNSGYDFESESSLNMDNDSDHVISRNVEIPYASLSTGNDRSSEIASQNDQSKTLWISSQSSHSQSSQKEASSSESEKDSSSSSSSSKAPVHDYMKDVQAIYKKVHFIALISDPSKVRKVSQQEFDLVVTARKNVGIRESDRLFKYEFKMNYRKFGKTGNRLNNQLMHLVSHPK